MKADPTYSLDSIQSDVGNLYRLLDTVFDAVMDMDFGSEDGTRNHKLDRVAALTQIARDWAGSLDERIDTNFQTIKGITR
jgi:hypothetical protein